MALSVHWALSAIVLCKTSMQEDVDLKKSRNCLRNSGIGGPTGCNFLSILEKFSCCPFCEELFGISEILKCDIFQNYNMPSEQIMYTKAANGALPYDLDYLTEDLRKRAKVELFEDEDTRVHSLKLLKSMLKEEKGLHWQDDDNLLLAFLRARKFDVKRAFSVIKNFYTVMGKHHELYHNFDYSDVKRRSRTSPSASSPTEMTRDVSYSSYLQVSIFEVYF
ncbi:CRAL_TRIO_N domain-containing protein [Caerostris darwini]|uniref:CRAL_TRIO_N domain-containing protein n=1 Tax=Caerostris darwini TaxID=1538125 RepID=A0AAV4RM88_9ARAC|nr:CRAL_TRIO_N domain-containing protein [Caerostris darwini]